MENFILDSFERRFLDLQSIMKMVIKDLEDKFFIKKIVYDHVMNRVACADARVIVKDISWFVSRYTPKLPKNSFLSKHILTDARNKLSFIEASVFVKTVNAEFNWSSEHKVEIGTTCLLQVIIGFRQTDYLKS